MLSKCCFSGTGRVQRVSADVNLPPCRLKIVEPTWEEAYGEDIDPKPFADFFSRDPDEYYGGVRSGVHWDLSVLHSSMMRWTLL